MFNNHLHLYQNINSCNFVQLDLWSWRVPSFLWWREKLWLCTVELRQPPPTSQLISIKMASSSRLSPQSTWPSKVSPSPMKVSTSASSLELENHQRAGWLWKINVRKHVNDPCQSDCCLKLTACVCHVNPCRNSKHSVHHMSEQNGELAKNSWSNLLAMRHIHCMLGLAYMTAVCSCVYGHCIMSTFSGKVSQSVQTHVW